MQQRGGWLGRARNTLKAIAEKGPIKGLRSAPHTEEPIGYSPVAGEILRDRDVMATSDRAVLADLQGLKMALLPGARPRVIVHWATWCEGCVQELPALMRLRDGLRGQVDFVGFGWEAFSHPSADPRAHLASVEACAAENGLDFETLVFEGTPGALFDGLGISSSTQTIPQTWVVSGESTQRFYGLLDEATAAAITEWLHRMSPDLQLVGVDA